MFNNPLGSPLITDGDRIRSELKQSGLKVRDLANAIGSDESDLDYRLGHLSFLGEEYKQSLYRALLALVLEKG